MNFQEHFGKRKMAMAGEAMSTIITCMHWCSDRVPVSMGPLNRFNSNSVCWQFCAVSRVGPLANAGIRKRV